MLLSYVKAKGTHFKNASLDYTFPLLSPRSGHNKVTVTSLHVSQAGDDASEWSPASGYTWKTNKLRLRKGRSVVHKNLEDNYGAVIVANHEALAQVLEQVTHSLQEQDL